MGPFSRTIQVSDMSTDFQTVSQLLCHKMSSNIGFQKYGHLITYNWMCFRQSLQCFVPLLSFWGKVVKILASLAEIIHMPSTFNDYDCENTLHTLYSETMLSFGISNN